MIESKLGDVAEVGRMLGHDLVRYERMLRAAGLPPSVTEGIAVARGRHLPNERADRFVSKWLQLRVGALKRGRVVDPGITPDYLRRIDVLVCPVTRIALSHGRLLDSDWSIDRINNTGAYAPNNLAVMSVKANKAKGGRDFEDVVERSRRDATTNGLSSAEWLRMACLMLGPCFAEKPGSAPLLPLVAVAPHAAQPASQVIQYAFTRFASRQAGKNGLIKLFSAVSRNAAAIVRLQRFAEAMHQALKSTTPCWDAWLRPGVFDAFQAWRLAADGASWARSGAVAMQISRSQRLSQDRVQSWLLMDRGYFR